MYIRKRYTLIIMGIVLIFLGVVVSLINHRVSPSSTRGLINRDIVWYVPTPHKRICLTFDDGPDPVYTKQILNVLEENNVNATFFVIGNLVEQYPEVARLIIEKGNEIANHTYSHPILNRIGMKQLQQEIEKAHQVIVETTRTVPIYFRPPQGFYNRNVIDVANDMGYKTILWTWTQDTIDWCNPGVNYIVNKVIKNAENGDIIIFHDSGGNRSQTVTALKIIIKELKERDYELVTVTELLDEIKEDNESRTLLPYYRDWFIYE